MAEGARLESVYTRKGIAGSNPALSARLRLLRARPRYSFVWQARQIPMWFVYIIKSLAKEFTYVGSTNDLERRILDHNEGKVQSTKHYKPFELVAYVAVKTEAKARELEKYFKVGSGKAILKKRIL